VHDVLDRRRRDRAVVRLKTAGGSMSHIATSQEASIGSGIPPKRGGIPYEEW